MSLKNRANLQEFESGNAIMHLQARRVSLYCNPKNVRSVRVAERCGFVREGYVRENYQNKNGTVSDTLCYGILKREYESTFKEENKERT